MGVPSIAARHVMRRRRRPRGGQAFDPLAAFDWKAAFYAGDPLWTPPADGGPVAAWKNGGTTRTEGAYLSAAAGLTLPGTSGNYASVPDEAALDITGDIDIRVKVALDDWTPALTNVLLSKRDTTAANFAYELRVNTAGTLRFTYGDSSTTVVAANSTTATGVTDGTVKWVRATRDATTGDVEFYLSDDGESWSQLGSTVSTAAGSIYANTTVLGIGDYNASPSSPSAGNLYNAEVYDGIAGSKVLDVDFQRADTNKFTCTSGQTVTVHNSLDAVQATGTKQPAYRASVAALNDKPAIQGDGVDDFLQTAAWSSALAQPYSAVFIGSIGSTTGADYATDGIAVSNRFLLSGLTGAWRINTGSSATGGTADTDHHLFVAVTGATDTLAVDGTGVVSGDAGAQTLTGLTISASYTGATPNDGHVAFVGVIAGDITAEANWPAFVAWVESHYGLVIA